MTCYMHIMHSQLLNILQERGFINDCTDLPGLDALLAGGRPVPVYIGFDCTAPSLHAGSLVQIMALRWVQKCGHKPIVLMGGGTTKIGDPSWRDESRPLLTDEAIQANMKGIRNIFSKYLSFGDGPADAIMVNNDDWLKELSYAKFLRDYGRHFSINYMLTMDSVKLRLEREQHLSFLEFNYMILQAYDFYYLNKNHDCRLQIGGSDQWGNIVSGIELKRKIFAEESTYTRHSRITPEGKPDIKAVCKDIQEIYERSKLYGLTTPLITTASGAKMGKTAQGAIWLNADMCLPYDFWQFWRNTEDADVGRFLRLFTELPLDEIEKLENLEGAEINQAKIILANEATSLCHGTDAAKQAADTARKLFEEGVVGGALPVIEVKRSELEKGIPAYLLFKEAGLAESGGEARRLIKGNGARINGHFVPSEHHAVTVADLGDDGAIKLSAGKKRHALVRAV